VVSCSGIPPHLARGRCRGTNRQPSSFQTTTLPPELLPFREHFQTSILYLGTSPHLLHPYPVSVEALQSSQSASSSASIPPGAAGESGGPAPGVQHRGSSTGGLPYPILGRLSHLPPRHTASLYTFHLKFCTKVMDKMKHTVLHSLVVQVKKTFTLKMSIIINSLIGKNERKKDLHNYKNVFSVLRYEILRNKKYSFWYRNSDTPSY